MKSRARDEANDFGCFALLDHQTGGLVFGWNALGGYVASLDEIVEYLTGDDTVNNDASLRE